MLEDFARLADAPPDRILKYAEEWGPLWLCEHGVYWRLQRAECYPRTQPDAGQRWSWDRECLDHWRKLAAEPSTTARSGMSKTGRRSLGRASASSAYSRRSMRASGSTSGLTRPTKRASRQVTTWSFWSIK